MAIVGGAQQLLEVRLNADQPVGRTVESQNCELISAEPGNEIRIAKNRKQDLGGHFDRAVSFGTAVAVTAVAVWIPSWRLPVAARA